MGREMMMMTKSSGKKERILVHQEMLPQKS